jgi:hypothetical protein
MDRLSVEDVSRCCAMQLLWLSGQGPRCTGCGHRQPWDDYVPVQTRSLPFWTWPAELWNRRQVILLGRQMGLSPRPWSLW